jgi:type I restriction enzyme R subunit
LELDPDLIDDLFDKNKAKRKSKELEVNLLSRIRNRSDDERYIKLGERLEELRERQEQGLLTSTEFLKSLLVLARDVAQAEKEIMPEPEMDKGIAALTELFNDVKNKKTPVIVGRIVADIDGIVKIVRFDGWQSTCIGKQEVKKALRSIIWVKYKIKDNDIFEKAYKYIEMHY